MGLFGQVLNSRLVPRSAQVQLQRSYSSPIQCGVSNEYCWCLVEQQRVLLLWKFGDGSDARVFTLSVPSEAVAGPSAAPANVAVLSPRPSSATVVLCSATGVVAAWLDCNYLSEPLLCRTAASSVTAFSAVASGSGFLAAVCAADGCVHLVQGSQQGLQGSILASPTSDQGKSGVIGSLLTWAYTEAFDPGAKYVKKSPSGRPAVGCHIVPADSTTLHVYVLTDSTLDCWRVGALGFVFVPCVLMHGRNASTH